MIQNVKNRDLFFHRIFDDYDKKKICFVIQISHQIAEMIVLMKNRNRQH